MVPQTENSDQILAIETVQELPDQQLDEHWQRIFVPAELKERLLAQALVSMNLRGLSPLATSLQGLIMLTGEPGVGKTSLARGLANQLAKEMGPTLFAEVNPHALPSDLLGQSQRAVSRLIQAEIAGLADRGKPAVVLIDEVEALAVSRSEVSLKANPVDVHRATDALLAGLDRLMVERRNVLILATTNFPKGVDEAFISRADLVMEVPPPNEEMAVEIVADTLKELGKQWPEVGQLSADGRFRKVAAFGAGLSGRTLRKAVVQALASRMDTAKDPRKLTVDDIESSIRFAKEARNPQDGGTA